MPFSLRSIHDLIFVFDEVFGALGLPVCLLNLAILLLLKLDLAHERVQSLRDEVVSDLDQLLWDSIR